MKKKFIINFIFRQLMILIYVVLQFETTSDCNLFYFNVRALLFNVQNNAVTVTPLYFFVPTCMTLIFYNNPILVSHSCEQIVYYIVKNSFNLFAWSVCVWNSYLICCFCCYCCSCSFFTVPHFKIHGNLMH